MDHHHGHRHHTAAAADRASSAHPSSTPPAASRTSDATGSSRSSSISPCTRTGSTATNSSTELLPDGTTVTPPTIRRAIAEARAWTGKDTSTDPPTEFIPAISPAGGDRYRITGHLTDWDLFRRLRKRAQARAAADQHTAAVTDYTAALALIRGPVLHPLRAAGTPGSTTPTNASPT